MNNCLIIIFPTQLFEKKYLENIFNYNEDSNQDNNNKNVKNNINKYVILWEHDYFFTRYKYHKLKLAFHRSSMQKYYDDLDKNYKKLYINNIDKNPDNLIQNFIKKNNINSIRFFNPIEKQLFNLIEHKKIIKNSGIMRLSVPPDTQRVADSDRSTAGLSSAQVLLKPGVLDIEHLIFPSPYFLNSSSFKINDNIQKELNGTIRHDVFYKKQRIMYDVMVKNKNNKHEPEGGKWSFDTENRKPYEKDHKDPGILTFKNKTRLEYIKEAIKYVNTNYKNHYGTCEEEDFIYPIDHEESIKWLDNFVKDKLDNFGKYEDALSTKIKFGYHSMLSALNNVGLITSQDILNKVKNYKKNIASKEGFIRQVIGWREYCYFIYDKYNDSMILSLQMFRF
jgi:deoxyribodipyrimidine photolyase-related protein